MVKRQRLRQSQNSEQRNSWDSFAWTQVDTDSLNIGGVDDVVFFGLEELDGSAYELAKNSESSAYTVSMPKTKALTNKPEIEQPSKRKKLNTEKPKQTVELSEVEDGIPDAVTNADKMLKEKNKRAPSEKKVKTDSKPKKNNELNAIKDMSDTSQYEENSTLKIDYSAKEKKSWGRITLPSILVDSLLQLGFEVPTPIQAAGIPLIHNGNTDVVGAAETGSGKTLAFCLPVITALIENWNDLELKRKETQIACPFALIVVPTRELALQISSVVKQVCLPFRKTFRIEIASVVGGMSEHKQRRQLDGRPVHILVATPGRLCELMQDESIPAFQNMSNIRFLIVDEADRIVEEGHFPELHKVFSRIIDHETSELKATTNTETQNEGDMYIAGENFESRLFELDFPLPEFEAMPTEEELERVRLSTPAIPIDEVDDGAEQSLRAKKKRHGKKVFQDKAGSLSANPRQTLLFSATALKSKSVKSAQNKSRALKVMKSKGLTKAIAEQLPEHLQELLASVAIRPNIEIVDVTSANASTLSNCKVNTSQHAVSGSKTTDVSIISSLPKLLTHYQISVPAEEKDLHAYYFLNKNPNHRTLLFVNSIKTARRVDGLLRALGFNCRTIHAQLQQRQRLRALEAFQASPVGVLVATDVAARGLDVSRISSVIHYDIARSPQVYIHRSGRTARANQSGISVSLVAPEDYAHHNNICQTIGTLPNMTPYITDSESVGVLRSRVKLAKQIFTESFVDSQKTKDDAWVQQSVTAADLPLDDFEIGTTKPSKGFSSKKQLERKRQELKKLVSTPIELATGGISSRKKGFVVFNPFV